MLGDTAYTFQCPPGVFARTLTMEQRRHLFLLYKEVLHNVVRHAQAEQVTISVARRDGVLVLEVRDDGVGFDPDAAHPGTGLRSVRARARALGGRLTVQSQPRAGTTVRLTVRMAESRDGFLDR
jgi:signal transduction histidine kinase